jgi:hypothetical protein
VDVSLGSIITYLVQKKPVDILKSDKHHEANKNDDPYEMHPALDLIRDSLTGDFSYQQE